MRSLHFLLFLSVFILLSCRDLVQDEFEDFDPGGIKGSRSSQITLQYGAGGGLAFYFWKRTGLYTEVIYEKYHYREYVNVRYGVTKKF